jgi:hypothetical protein
VFIICRLVHEGEWCGATWALDVSETSTSAESSTVRREVTSIGGSSRSISSAASSRSKGEEALGELASVAMAAARDASIDADAEREAVKTKASMMSEPELTISVTSSSGTLALEAMAAFRPSRRASPKSARFPEATRVIWVTKSTRTCRPGCAGGTCGGGGG